jgi:ADP-ribosylglycohydrolase
MARNEDKIRGALYGVAIGDALGGPLEFMNAEQIKQKYGGRVTEMVGGGWLSLTPGETTDDTAMTLAVCEGIMENSSAPIEPIGRRFIEWVNTAPKDIGMTCARSIQTARANLATGMDAEAAWGTAGKRTAEENGDRSGGNGALMRTIGTALVYEDAEERAERTTQIAEMTHYDALSSDICRYYADAVHRFIKDEQDAGLIPLYTMAGVSEYGFSNCVNPSGWAPESMECAFFAFITEGDFENALITAVNLGGDADTIGAITGGLAGAYYGYDAIPQRWIEAIPADIRERLDAFAKWVVR